MHTGNKQQSVKFLKSFSSALCLQGKIIRIVGLTVLHRMAKPAKQQAPFGSGRSQKSLLAPNRLFLAGIWPAWQARVNILVRFNGHLN